MIELRGVGKVFGKRIAVENLDLEVPRGSIFGLLGHNGAGKSTTIGMILGQVWPSAGTIRVCGHDITCSRRHALEKVGAIFEAPAFYDYLTAWQNLEILAHYSAPTSAARMKEVIEWVGLSGREHSKVRTYSHGMRARLALAQSLLPKPELLILDEPSDGLDPHGIYEMRETILRLRSEMGLTILLSSHLLSEVEQLCGRIAIMNQGRKVFEGDIAEAKSRPGWTRLRVDNFDRAIELLQRHNLITEARDKKLIRLANGIGADRVVQLLVENKIALFEIAPEEQTLESFYLELVKGGRP